MENVFAPFAPDSTDFADPDPNSGIADRMRTRLAPITPFAHPDSQATEDALHQRRLDSLHDYASRDPDPRLPPGIAGGPVIKNDEGPGIHHAGGFAAYLEGQRPWGDTAPGPAAPDLRRGWGAVPGSTGPAGRDNRNYQPYGSF